MHSVNLTMRYTTAQISTARRFQRSRAEHRHTAERNLHDGLPSPTEHGQEKPESVQTSNLSASNVPSSDLVTTGMGPSQHVTVIVPQSTGQHNSALLSGLEYLMDEDVGDTSVA